MEDNTCEDTFEDFGPLIGQLRQTLRDSEDAVKQTTGRCSTRLTLMLCSATFPPTNPTPASLDHVITPLRGLSRVEAGNPGFPRLVQVTSGGFSWWL